MAGHMTGIAYHGTNTLCVWDSQNPVVLLLLLSLLQGIPQL
jgi:hypothetical protein